MLSVSISSIRPARELARRQWLCIEVMGKRDEQVPSPEACRYVSCGNCFECDNCVGVRPGEVVAELRSAGFATKV